MTAEDIGVKERHARDVLLVILLGVACGIAAALLGGAS